MIRFPPVSVAIPTALLTRLLDSIRLPEASTLMPGPSPVTAPLPMQLLFRTKELLLTAIPLIPFETTSQLTIDDEPLTCTPVLPFFKAEQWLTSPPFWEKIPVPEFWTAV